VKRLGLEAGDFACLLYTWLIPHADDNAVLPTADAEELLDLVMPWQRDKSPEDVSAAIAAMLRIGLLEAGRGRLGFPPAAFYAYQGYIAVEKRRTAPLADWDPPVKERRHAKADAAGAHSTSGNQREPAETSGDRREPAGTSVSPSPSPSPSHSPTVTELPEPRARKPRTPKPPEGAGAVGKAAGTNPGMGDPATVQTVRAISDALDEAEIRVRPKGWYPAACRVVHDLLQGSRALKPEAVLAAARWCLTPEQSLYHAAKLTNPGHIPKAIAAHQAFEHGAGGRASPAPAATGPPPVPDRQVRRSNYPTADEVARAAQGSVAGDEADDSPGGPAAPARTAAGTA